MLVPLEVQVFEEPFSQTSDEDEEWSAASQALRSLPLGSGHPRPSGPSHTEEVSPHERGLGKSQLWERAPFLAGPSWGETFVLGKGPSPKSADAQRWPPALSSWKVVLTWFGGRGRGRLRSEGPSLSGPGSTRGLRGFPLGSDVPPPWLTPELTRAMGGRLPWGHAAWSGAGDAQRRNSKFRREKTEGSPAGRRGTSVLLA